LAAISLGAQQDFIPDFNKTSQYSFKKLQENFGYPAVDPLVFFEDPILKITKDPTQMQELAQRWTKAVTNYKMLYLKHRLHNMQYILLLRPGYEREVVDVAFGVTNNFPVNSISYKIIEYAVGGIFYLLMSHLPVVILGVCYIILALYNWNKSLSSRALLGFNATAMVMVILLFFMSMAGTPRYTYISVLLIHASHIFAYHCCKKQKIS
jgi:hypothetical protein